MRSRFLVCYDIADARRLRAIARLMEAHGERVQKSVFECELCSRELNLLLVKARELLDPKRDSLRVYTLCRRCSRARQLFGTGVNPETPDLFIF